MKEQNGKLSRDEFLSFVKAVLKKKSLEENKVVCWRVFVKGIILSITQRSGAFGGLTCSMLYNRTWVPLMARTLLVGLSTVFPGRIKASAPR